MCRVEEAPGELLERARKDLSLPNPEYLRRKRMGQWTGNLRSSLTLYRKKGDSGAVLPRGYAGSLLLRAREMGLTWDLEDRRMAWGKRVLSFRGELRPYQERALEEMIRKQSGVLAAPCGSGKTCMGLALAAHWGEPALVLVHTLDLLEQMRENVEHWLGISPGVIGGGRWDPHEVITVATVQTLIRRKKELPKLAKQFGTLLLDEAHHVPATTFTGIIQKFPAKYRYGLSATPEREDGLHPFLYAVMGPLRAQVTPEDLEQEGRLLRPHLSWILTDFRSSLQGREDTYTELMGELVASSERNRLIVKTAAESLSEGSCLLVLSERVEHCGLLAKALEAHVPGKVACLTGETPQKDRGGILEGVRGGDLSCLVASRIADEGLDIPRLDAILFATPFRGKAKGWQRIGRIMRTFQGKERPRIYDLLDWKVPLLKAQGRRRFHHIYRDLVENPAFPEGL
jgi:superfamily II DNA or RNA helicase